MTRIENRIYAAMMKDPEDGSALPVAQKLYRDAQRASLKVYKKIDFDALNLSITNHFGKEAFREIHRHAVAR
jgi:hypothetical protein